MESVCHVVGAEIALIPSSFCKQTCGLCFIWGWRPYKSLLSLSFLFAMKLGAHLGFNCRVLPTSILLFLSSDFHLLSFCIILLCMCLSFIPTSNGLKVGKFKSIGVCCWFITKSCLTLCDPMDCGLTGSSVHGILQARILHWHVDSIPLSHLGSPL